MPQIRVLFWLNSSWGNGIWSQNVLCHGDIAILIWWHPNGFWKGSVRIMRELRLQRQYLVWFSSPTTSRIQPVVDNLNGVSHQQAPGSVPSIGCALMVLVCC